jgi:hypothetical protein
VCSDRWRPKNDIRSVNRWALMAYSELRPVLLYCDLLLAMIRSCEYESGLGHLPVFNQPLCPRGHHRFIFTHQKEWLSITAGLVDWENRCGTSTGAYITLGCTIYSLHIMMVCPDSYVRMNMCFVILIDSVSFHASSATLGRLQP